MDFKGAASKKVAALQAAAAISDNARNRTMHRTGT